MTYYRVTSKYQKLNSLDNSLPAEPRTSGEGCSVTGESKRHSHAAKDSTIIVDDNYINEDEGPAKQETSRAGDSSESTSRLLGPSGSLRYEGEDVSGERQQQCSWNSTCKKAATFR